MSRIIRTGFAVVTGASDSRWFHGANKLGPIAGVGWTEDEARADAQQWAESLDNARVLPATGALIDAVRREGGSIVYELDENSTADLPSGDAA